VLTAHPPEDQGTPQDQGTPVSKSGLELAYLVLALGKTLGQRITDSIPSETHLLNNTTSSTMTTIMSPPRIHPPKHPTLPQLLTTPGLHFLCHFLCYISLRDERHVTRSYLSIYVRPRLVAPSMGQTGGFSGVGISDTGVW